MGQELVKWSQADGAGTATPAGHWIAIVGQISQAKQLTGLETAKGYALTGIALADAFIPPNFESICAWLTITD